MCYGLPVVISDSSSGPLELVRENGAGIVTACGDVDELAKALQLLINDSELRDRLGKKGPLVWRRDVVKINRISYGMRRSISLNKKGL